jgi:ribosome biogenesis GTPase
MSLEDFGWNPQRADAFAAHAREGFTPGRVVSEHRSHLQVVTTAGDIAADVSAEVSAEVSGRLRNEARLRSDLPAVGDFVALRPALADGPATVEALLPRTTALIRKASGENRPQVLAANVDVVFIVTAPDGDFNAARLERLLQLVHDSGAAPVILLNKADLTDDVPGFTKQIARVAPGVPCHVISARTQTSVAPLADYFTGNRTVGLVGSSGVGKSTLTNVLLDRDAQTTQPVRSHDSRGRHTTTHRQLFARAGGGCLIDMPGMRGVESWIGAADGESSTEQLHAAPPKPKPPKKRGERSRYELE